MNIKVILGGQVVFLGLLGGVMVTQMKGGKPHPAVVAPAAPGAADRKGGGEQPSPEHVNAEKAEGAEGKGADEEKGEAQAPGGAKESHPLVGDAKAIAAELLAGNARFVSGRRAAFDLSAQRAAAAEGQHPGAMVLGCADSRVSPELIFDRGLGELFVVRSAGDIAEPVAVGSLEYAAEHLHTKVIVVLGHDDCGAVKAAMSGEKMPTRNLEAVVDHIQPGLKGLKGWAEGAELVRMAVEANVRRQAEELLKRSQFLREAVARNEITILRAVYDIRTGRVRPL